MSLSYNFGQLWNKEQGEIQSGAHLALGQTGARNSERSLYVSSDGGFKQGQKIMFEMKNVYLKPGQIKRWKCTAPEGEIITGKISLVMQLLFTFIINLYLSIYRIYLLKLKIIILF